MVEHLLCKQGVKSSNLFISTKDPVTLVTGSFFLLSLTMSILIRNVLLGSGRTNIFIDRGLIGKIGVPDDYPAAQIIEAEGFAIFPAFYNTHCHAAMTLLRGYADDLPLQQWLQDYIWPYEDSLTDEDIERGSETAIREMIRGGSVFFNDMYFGIDRTIRYGYLVTT